MKKRIYYISLLLIYFSYLNVFAVEKCTTSEMTRLRELASNVEFKYEYNIDEIVEEEEKVFGYYKIKILNLDDDLRIYYRENNNLKFFSKTEIEKMEFSSSRREVFYVYSYTDNLCTDEVLRTVTIDFPVYNQYYYFNKEKCDGYADFNYCKEFFDIQDKSFSEIDKLFEEYKKGENVERKNENLIHQYIWYIVAGILILGIFIVIIVFKKHKNKEDI